VNCFAAGLDALTLVPPTAEQGEDSMVLIGLYMKNCMEWFIAEQGIFCLSGATGECRNGVVGKSNMVFCTNLISYMM
jgi:long-subunit acyl-CoA synthetase (AMP-forming)